MSMVRFVLAAWIGCALTAGAAPASAQYDVTASSFAGGAGMDELHGARILADGKIVVAGNVSGDPPGVTARLLSGATATSAGAVLVLAPDGRSVVSMTRLSAGLYDLASDADDELYLAAGAAGVVKLSADASTVVWTRAIGDVRRVDATPDGHVVALVGGAGDTPGAGMIHVLGPDGAPRGMFAGHRNTFDVAIHEPSQTVLSIGWRQANANDGTRTQPVQIAYLRGATYTGTTRWTDYDWPTDMTSASFLNRPENNMADTRGYRVSVGRDGRVYAAFECAGGNHIFRYSPLDVTQRVTIVGGDNFHTFNQTRSEHKTFFGIYDPMTGAYQTGQQLVGRLMNGDGNTVRVKDGAITADEMGRTYVSGASAFGIPTTFLPGPSTYRGGAYLFAMSADLRQRLYVTRMDPAGTARAVDARTVGGSTRIVLAGRSGRNGMGVSELYTLGAFQPMSGGGDDGFVTVIGAPAGTPLPDAGMVPAVDAGPGAALDAGSVRSDASASADGGAGPAAGGGCGCRVSGGSTAGAWLALGGLACLFAARRRHR